MRDRLMSFTYATVADGASNVLKVTPSTTVASLVTLSHVNSSGVPIATSNEFNYGGLLVNPIPTAFNGPGQVLDNNQSGSVDAADYVRGQILNPIYVTAAITVNQIPFTDTLTMAVHGSDTIGFTAGASNVISQSVFSPPLSSLNVSVTFVTGAGGAINTGVAYFITAINTGTGVLTLSTSRGGGALANLTSATVSVADAARLSVNQQLSARAAVGASTTLAVICDVVNDSNSTIISVPLQSYAKFLRVRWTASAARATASEATSASVVVARTGFQTGREGSI